MNNFKFKCFNFFNLFNRTRNNSDITRTSDNSINSEIQNQIVLNEMNKIVKYDLDNIFEKLGQIDIKVNENLNKTNLLHESLWNEINNTKLLNDRLEKLEEKINKLSNYNSISEELVIINNLSS
jgi:ATP-dependent Lon protease